jgi:hypothetical protein
MNAVQPPMAIGSGLTLNVQKHLPMSATVLASKLQNASSEELCYISVFVVFKD